MNRRNWLARTLLGTALLNSDRSSAFGQRAGGNAFGNALIEVGVLGSETAAWTLTSRSGARMHSFGPPIFEVNGLPVTGALSGIHPAAAPRRLLNGVSEYRFSGHIRNHPALTLEMIFQISPDNPVLRFSYLVRSSSGDKWTAAVDRQNLSYLKTSFSHAVAIYEIRLSVFNELLHSYTLSETSLSQRAFEDTVSCMGPILTGSDAEGHTLLIAYEHGSQAPDAFLEFRLASTREVSLRATKGNYLRGFGVNAYQTLWMEAGAAPGGLESMAGHFRTFVLAYMNERAASRQPYVFYNTWNFQERNKWSNGAKYLESMTPNRILAEIDVAHRMGIEVFVLDTGWYETTGDWQVSRARFPDELKDIRRRLDSYGMKLGLWFSPTHAAVSSRLLSRYKQSVLSWHGQEGKPSPVWETEASFPMCLVSPYSDGFAEELIRVAHDTGARYFKWDAIGQYGCDSPDHWHGGHENTPSERADSYAFQLPLQMARIVDKLCTAIPDAIVDFDVTEAGRAVGLSFLSAGKFFLINNGPYLFNYDLPLDREKQNWNLFFYPGPARTWICRSPLMYDAWIPSTLFLTHYFPDDPTSSQLVNVASLILGQNGIWGDLLKVSSEGVEFINHILGKYKRVRLEMANSYPLTTGAVGSSPEVHEKISERTGKGAVVIFSTARGSFRYITNRKPSRDYWATPGTTINFDEAGRALIEPTFSQSGASITFFGIA